jgi:hypothetical protein
MRNTVDPAEWVWFWNLIDTSERSLQKLCRKLEALSKEELVTYQRLCWEAKESVNPHSRFEEMQPLSSPCSEDDADDFAGWVVGEGRLFFEEVESHPSQVQTYWDVLEDESGPQWDISVDVPEYSGFQRVDMIATPIYEARFHEELQDAVEEALDDAYAKAKG